MLTDSEYEKLRRAALTVGIHLGELPTVRAVDTGLPAGRHLVWVEVAPPKWEGGGIGSTKVSTLPRPGTWG